MSFNWLKYLGPGLLYAGAAIGVSHLVQSTRAGAEYGYTLVWAIILANLLKYPFFEFGPRYAASTGKSLLHGYESLGKWALISFFIITLSVMFIIQSAVTIVTSGLLAEIFNLNIAPWILSTIILFACTLLLIIGKYRVLDRTMKSIILILSISTITALIASFFGTYDKAEEYFTFFTFSNKKDVLFLIALMGWMPAPLDISVWHSVWTIEKSKNVTYKNPLKQALVDFKIGYWGTLILAICFVTLGANTIYGTGTEIAESGSGFAKQIINIYTNNIGSWSYFIIAIAAFTTMFSTTLTCLDAFPRVMSDATKKLIKPKFKLDSIYWFWIITIVLITVFILAQLLSNMKTMVEVATIVSFITSPVLAILNYLVITGKTIKKENQPKTFLKTLSWLGIIYFLGFTIYYIYIIS